MAFITMKSSLVLCVLLGIVFSVRAASVSSTVEDVTVTTPLSTLTGMYNDTSTLQTTVTTPLSTLTEMYNDTSTLQTTIFTTPYPTTTATSTPPTPSTPYPSTTVTTIPTTPYPTATSIPCCMTTSTTTTTTTPATTITLTPPPPPPPVHTTHGPLTQSQMMCHDGWEVFQGRCYYFVNDGMTWPQAQSSCAMMESMLVSVHSAQEYGFLQQLTQNNGVQEAWLGGFYLQNQWLWMDGSWFYNNSWSSESQDSSSPCLMLSSFEAWSNSPCDVGDYTSICVKKSNVPPSMLCPEGWTGFQGRCYYYNYDSLSWPDADANCAGLGASLVSVHSPEEYFFLYQQTAVNGYGSTWLGGFYLEDQWLWLDGSWFYQGFFTQMSPDSTSPCLSTYTTDGWSNYECNENLPSFCVKNAVI